MKIGVLTDTHDNLEAINRAAKLFAALEVDRIFHLGDFVAPFTAFPLLEAKIPLEGVFGNNDGDREALLKRYAPIGEIHTPPWEVERGGKRFLLLHEPGNLELHLQGDRYDFILYGHLHRFHLERRGKTTLFNPGESGGHLTGKPVVGLIDTLSAEAEIYPL